MVLIVVLAVLAAALVLSCLWLNIEITSEVEIRNPEGAAGTALLVYHPGRSDFQEKVTYAFVDAVDSWVEHCKEGKYYREDGDAWIHFSRRREVIERKKKDPVEVTFFQNDHGVLDGDPDQEGYYLATRWLAGERGARSLESILHMWDVTSVDEAMRTLARVETGWNFVISEDQEWAEFLLSAGLLIFVLTNFFKLRWAESPRGRRNRKQALERKGVVFPRPENMNRL